MSRPLPRRRRSAPLSLRTLAWGKVSTLRAPTVTATVTTTRTGLPLRAPRTRTRPRTTLLLTALTTAPAAPGRALRCGIRRPAVVQRSRPLSSAQGTLAALPWGTLAASRLLRTLRLLPSRTPSTLSSGLAGTPPRPNPTALRRLPPVPHRPPAQRPLPRWRIRPPRKRGTPVVSPPFPHRRTARRTPAVPAAHRRALSPTTRLVAPPPPPGRGVPQGRLRLVRSAPRGLRTRPAVSTPRATSSAAVPLRARERPRQTRLAGRPPLRTAEPSPATPPRE